MPRFGAWPPGAGILTGLLPLEESEIVLVEVLGVLLGSLERLDLAT